MESASRTACASARPSCWAFCTARRRTCVSCATVRGAAAGAWPPAGRLRRERLLHLLGQVGNHLLADPQDDRREQDGRLPDAEAEHFVLPRLGLRRPLGVLEVGRTLRPEEH